MAFLPIILKKVEKNKLWVEHSVITTYNAAWSSYNKDKLENSSKYKGLH